ncbi:caspase domain-containing protein [Streptomyces sp. NPDC051218]|uniref:caspase domain-containing protein n=1 Tax=Streptomyces sp. NPDC051218 TaxID=3365645 RepID=UPI0037AD75AE
MTLRLPDPRGSRAVLIGTSQYDSATLPNLLAVRNNLEVLQGVLASDSYGGFPVQRCTVVRDASDPRAVCATVRAAAMTATDTLLVYFSGHGVLGDDLSLHLALSGTDENDLRWTSIPFEAIREIFEASPCPNKVLILDCCNSGQVLDSLMGAQVAAHDTLNIRGTYILTSSSRDLPSYAPVKARHTAFSGALIKLLQRGLPDGSELLTLSELYGPLAKALREQGYPQPRQQSSDGHAWLALVKNRAVVAGPVAAAAAASGLVPEAPMEGEIRFNPNRTFHRIRNWGIGGPIAIGLLAVAGMNAPTGKETTLEVTDPRHVIAILAFTGFLGLSHFMGKRYPGDYSLVLSPDGLEVQYSGSQHFAYPWHRVNRCWIRRRAGTRLRHPRYELMIQPMDGGFPQTAGRHTPGPHHDGTEGNLRFAELGRLSTTPQAVEAALARYAGDAWTQSDDLDVSRAPVVPGEEVFTPDRRILATVAVVCTVLGLYAFPFSVFVEPARILRTLVPLITFAVCLGVAWFAFSRCLRPVRLVIGAAGLTLTRGELEITYAWTEVERIAVVTWPRGARNLGLLAVRPLGSAEGRIDRTNRLLPKLAPGAVTLCMLPEVTYDQRPLKAALARFADKEHLELPGEAWLRPNANAPAAVSTGVTFQAQQPTSVSFLTGLVLAAPSATCVGLMDQPLAPPWLPVLNDVLLSPFFFIALATYFLTGRHHVRLHLSPLGLTLRAFGTRRLHISWSDVERIGFVARPDPAEHALLLWPSAGTHLPRPWWLPLKQLHGGLRVLTLETYRFEASAEQVDQALARYAGRRHTRMTMLRQTPAKKK